MAMNNYEILGLNKADNPSQEQIRAAWKKLVKEHHPDLNPNNKDAEDRIKEINRAYDELQKGITGDEPASGGPGASGHYTDPFDVFRDFFRHSSRGGFGGFSNPTLTVTVPIEISKIVHGGDIGIGYDRPMRLPDGRVVNQRVTKRVTLAPDTPVADYIVFKGEGGHDDPDKPAGDLRLAFHLMDDETYKIDNNAIHVMETISAIEAMTGTEREIATLDGKRVKLKVQPGTQPGTIYMLKDRGIRLSGHARLNLGVHMNVVIPEITNPDHVDLLGKIMRGEEVRYYDPSDIDMIDLDGP